MTADIDMALLASPYSSATVISSTAPSSDPKLEAPPHPGLLFSQSTPRSAPTNPTALLSPFASGACSELFKCVVKKPEIVQVDINGELQTNAPDVTAQFLAELLVYTTVSRHRNIVAFLGSLEGVGMVMEYVEGRSLFQVLRQRPQISRELKIDFHNQLLDGLAHLHSFGFSHGDLSLLNVMVAEPSKVIKLFDFGRSTTVHDTQQGSDTASTSTITLDNRPVIVNKIHPGTRPFTAPEILREECTDARLADAYSFGIILLCMDRGGLVNLEARNQKKDILPDLSGLEVFPDVIPPYLQKWTKRRRIARENRIHVPSTRNRDRNAL
ncbi:kinase-like protein [Exidia glandulosa HHB12029]|uniref:Kinase-like protein n=1 Tax=Exidia glandulosa HHB12029 TaxID=1314781 RepID=A0A165F498_EXIGL|nr:kinase-like protein [Exidia glandulosa HHB12029]